jgi:hypothetical protein
MLPIAALLAAAPLATGCAGMVRLLDASAGPPPQAPVQAVTISRTAIAFALNSFDAALYGLDAMMDLGRLQPGSQRARDIARIGRQIMAALGAAEAARDIGSAATYEEAFARAQSALTEFRTAIGITAAPGAWFAIPAAPLTAAERDRILRRLEAAVQA